MAVSGYQVFELELLNRTHGFPGFAARAVPDEPLTAIAAHRATVAGARHGETPQTAGDALDGRAPLLRCPCCTQAFLGQLDTVLGSASV